MRVTIDVLGPEPPAGSPVLVRILDTTMQDVDAPVLAEARSFWGAGPVELDFDPPPGADSTVSVHIDADRDGTVSEGDFITMQSYPCRDETRVEVRRI